MNEEEAIKRCKQIIKDNNEIIKEARKNRDINSIQLTASLDNDSIAIETVLNLLEKKDEEIEKYKMMLAENCARTLNSNLKQKHKHEEDLEALHLGWKEEIEKKDKMIELMAIAIGNEPLPTEEYCIFRNFDCPAVGGNRDCKECVKQYFERKLEEDK